MSLNLLLQFEGSYAKRILSLTEYWKLLSESLVFNRFKVIETEENIKTSLKNNQGFQTELTSLFALGYALEIGATVADNKELQVLKALFSLIDTIDKTIKQFFSSVINLLNPDDVTISLTYKNLMDLVVSLVKQRDSLANVLHQKLSYSAQRLPFSWDSMIVCLKWIRKSISKLLTFLSDTLSLSSFPFKDNVMFIEQGIAKLYRMIGEMWEYRIQFENSRLWKEGGHAAVPITNLDWQHLREIRSLFDSSFPQMQHFLDANIDKLSNSVGTTNRSHSPILKEWLSLYSTFYWSRTSESYYSDESDHKLNFVTLIDAFRGKVEKSLHVVKESVEMDEDIDNDNINYSDAFDIDITSTVNFTQSSTQNIQDEYDDASSLSIISCVETSVLSTFEQISNYLAKLLLKNDLTLDDVLTLKENCEFVLNMTIRLTAFSPICLREIQTLLWCLEACNEDLDNNKSILLTLSRSFICSLDAVINSLFSRNVMNAHEGIDFSYGSQTLQAVLYPEKFKVLTTSTHASWCKPLFTGSVKLLQPSKTDIILRHIDIRSLFTTTSCGPVIEENSNLCALLTIATSKLAKEKLLYIFRTNIEISDKMFLSEAYGRISLLSQLTIDVIYCCRDFYPSRIKEQIKSIRANLDVIDLANVFKSLKDLNLHSTCLNRQLGEMFEKCLSPLLNTLSIAQFHVVLQENIVLMARCWIMIGILRVYLSLPSTPVDPAVVSGIKADLFCHRMNSLEVRSEARERLVDMAGGFASISNRDEEEKNLLKSKVNKLETRRIQRPTDAEPFTTVFSDLHNSITTIVDMDRLITLADNISDSYETITKQSTGVSQRKKVYDQLIMYVKEELNWQGLAGNFIDKTREKMSDFEDILSPIVASLHNISVGLRLLTSWTFSVCDDIVKTSSVNGNKFTVAAWSNILQYPYPSEIKLNDSHKTSLQATQSVERLLLSCEYLLPRASKHQQEVMNNTYKNDDSMLDFIGPQTLFLHAISKINYLVGGGTVNPSDLYELFNRILSKFVDDQLKVEEKLKQLALGNITIITIIPFIIIIIINNRKRIII